MFGDVNDSHLAAVNDLSGLQVNSIQISNQNGYNITGNHRLSGSFSVIDTYRDPDYLNSADVQFPGAPNYERYDSLRPLYSATLRSTLGANLVNELRGGTTRGGASYFGSLDTNGAQTFEGTDSG